MKWRWQRSDEEKKKDTVELEIVQRRLKYVMAELRRTLDHVEARLEKELKHG